MKINIEELKLGSREIQVKGDEPWLNAIYTSFPDGDPSKKLPLTANFLLSIDDYEFATVRGEVTYQPFVICSRCSDPIPWPIRNQFDLEFRPVRSELANDSDLEFGELNSYHYDEDGNIDLEMVLNDLVQTALPTKLICRSEDGQSCLHCHCDLTKDLVYGSGKQDHTNPFAVLKSLNLDS